MTCLVWKRIKFILRMAECVEESTVSDENCPHRFVTATETVTVTVTMNRQILLSIWVTPCGAVAQNVRPYHV